MTAPLRREDTLIETLIRLKLPYLDSEAANEEIIRLTMENMKLQAELDAVALLRQWAQEDGA